MLHKFMQIKPHGKGKPHDAHRRPEKPHEVDWDAVDAHYASYCHVNKKKMCGKCSGCQELIRSTKVLERDTGFHFSMRLFHQQS